MQTNIKEYDESFDLTQALQKKGTKEYGFIHLAQRANGSWVNIPKSMKRNFRPFKNRTAVTKENIPGSAEITPQ